MSEKEYKVLDKVWIVYKQYIDVTCPTCHQVINKKYIPIEVEIVSKTTTCWVGLNPFIDKEAYVKTTYKISPIGLQTLPIGMAADLINEGKEYYAHNFYDSREIAEENIFKWIDQATREYRDEEKE